MRARHFVAPSLLVAVSLAGPEAIAGSYPDEYYSHTPNMVTACPAGDMVFGFTLRDYMNRPLRNNLVTLAIDHCPVQLATVLGDEGYEVDFTYGADYPFLSQTTDNAAQVRFAIRAGGTCPTRMGVIIGINGMLWYRPLASPDQDGNLSVGPEDVALVSAKLGTSDPAADLDGDGTVTAADLAILNAHLGHHAPGMATPVASRSWGTLKLLYR